LPGATVFRHDVSEGKMSKPTDQRGKSAEASVPRRAGSDSGIRLRTDVECAALCRVRETAPAVFDIRPYAEHEYHEWGLKLAPPGQATRDPDGANYLIY
jgi:hypothetical protein